MCVHDLLSLGLLANMSVCFSPTCYQWVFSHLHFTKYRYLSGRIVVWRLLKLSNKVYISAWMGDRLGFTQCCSSVVKRSQSAMSLTLER